MKPVTTVGLGNMGAPMAEHLVAAGFELAAYDPDASRVDGLVQRGGERFERTRSYERCCLP